MKVIGYDIFFLGVFCNFEISRRERRNEREEEGREGGRKEEEKKGKKERKKEGGMSHPRLVWITERNVLIEARQKIHVIIKTRVHRGRKGETERRKDKRREERKERGR